MTFTLDGRDRCPLCNTQLVKQPTVAENFQSAQCFGMKLNEDGSFSSSRKCGYRIILKDGEIIDEQWTGKKEPEGFVKTVVETFNGRETKMGEFDLSGYQPEVVKDNDFEIITGKGFICKVNSSIIEEVPAGSNDRGSYDAYTRLKYELEIVSGDKAKRKLWKTYNLSSTQKSGKKEKTPIQKLADAFFTIGLEFSDMESLEAANEKFVDLLLVVSCSKFKPKGGDEMQLHTITGIAKDEDEGITTSASSEVKF